MEVDKEDKSKSLQAKLSYLLSSQHGNTYNDLSICSAIVWNMICAEIDRMQMRKQQGMVGYCFHERWES